MQNSDAWWQSPLCRTLAAAGHISFRLPSRSPAFHIQPGALSSQCVLVGQARGADVISDIDLLSLSTVMPWAGSPSTVRWVNVGFPGLQIQC